MTTRAGIGKTRVTTGSAAPSAGRAPLWRVLAALALCLLAGACNFNREEAPDLALWRIVDSACNHPVRDQPGDHVALQCETANGYAVLKDRCGATHFLLIPTVRRTGVESPALQNSSEPDYFAYAWAERGRSLHAEAFGATAQGDVALAVNSRWGRSQSQLHVHIDRLRREVRSALAAVPRALAPDAQVTLMGHRYRIAHFASMTESPFVWAARVWAAHNEDERARLTVAVVGDGAAGFFYLADRADPTALDRGHAEELLVAHDCMLQGALRAQ